MPDAPDFFQYRLESDKNVLGDMAELAVRLGSVVKYDRAGSVLFVDSFDHGLAPYLKQLSGAGSAVDIVSGTTYASGYSVRLTAGSDVSRTAGVMKRLAPQVINKIGFEFSFSLDTIPDYVQMTIQQNTETERKAWAIRWHAADGTIKCTISGAPYPIFATQNLPTENKEIFHTIKLVVDLETEYYMRFMADQESYDLSAYKGQKWDDIGKPRLEFSAWVFGHSGENDIMYVDDFIVTTDEIK